MSNKNYCTSIQSILRVTMTNLTRIMNLNISLNASLFNFTEEGLLMPENINSDEEEGGKILDKKYLGVNDDY